MKILIIGGGGYVGSLLVQKLVEKNKRSCFRFIHVW